MSYINKYNRFIQLTKYLKPLFFLVVAFNLSSCNKYVEVDSVTDKLLADQVFSNDATANAAISGIYRQSMGSLIYSTTLYNSLASDDVVSYAPNSLYDAYQNNAILSNNSVLPWAGLYNIIYSCNSAIENLKVGSGTTEKARTYYTAEAKFNRAFSYFYLVNLFGDVPLVTTIDVGTTATSSRVSSDIVYNQIISDLKEAQAGLDPNYDYTGGEHIRANKWVATALLARVYLYQRDWKNAEEQASSVINSMYYSLLDNPSGIFQKNNREAILQYGNNSTDANTVAGYFIFTSTPKLVCSQFLLNAFEPGDLRKSTWIKSGTTTSQLVYYPFKFTTTAVASNENYTVLRLAEQYLIRAEARAMQGDFADAIDDVNLIRLNHGGLTNALPTPIDQNECIDAIMRERQVDLFTEGMHRWFDLKRTNRLDSLMKLEKPTTWNSDAALYPLPLADLQTDQNLTQNPGY